MIPTQFGRDDERWDAVCRRDVAADGFFVLAVRTTGIVCRPGCPARRPRRENVEFFATLEAAVAAGFRACKRCKPAGSPPRDELVELVAQACRTIDAAETAPALNELAAAAGKSPFYFARSFKRIVGMTPREYARARRAEQLRGTLPAHRRVSDAMYEAGFGSSSIAYSQAAASLGMAPAVFRAGGRGQRMRVAATSTRLGWVAVARTERGVAAVELGDSGDEVRARIAARFSAADLQEDAVDLGPILAAIVAYIERPARGLDLPLDVAGTAFTRRVWLALTQVRPGQTATYGEIARSVGRPGAARASPCHRVVPAAGGTGGYRWGADRKRQLLDDESEN